jgi:hypothetical protein
MQMGERPAKVSTLAGRESARHKVLAHLHVMCAAMRHLPNPLASSVDKNAEFIRKSEGRLRRFRQENNLLKVWRKRASSSSSSATLLSLYYIVSLIEYCSECYWYSTTTTL